MSVAGFAVEELRCAAVKAAATAAAAAEELNAQDARLGDGDLGITVSGGYAEIAKVSDEFPPDVGEIFLQCAKAFQRVSSSSYGTLTATAFLAVSKQSKGRTKIPWEELGVMLELARDAMMARGKGCIGDKSVLDLLDGVARATKGLSDAESIRAAARCAASESLDDFRARPCKLGRARAYGDATIGVDDPGMLALSRLIHGL